jgi:hypothetical protein
MIMRAAPDDDVYCIWSSNVDGAIFIGDRDDIVRYALDHYRGRMQTVEDLQRQIHRTMAVVDHSGASQTEGIYTASGLIVLDGGAHEGWLPRERLGTWLRTQDVTLLESLE